MKKIAASLLAFILILSFCACGQSSTSENSSDIETAFSTAASVEPVTEVVQSTESEGQHIMFRLMATMQIPAFRRRPLGRRFQN